jgi:hypothetical protein
MTSRRRLAALLTLITSAVVLSAGEVAYTDDINAVTVRSRSKAELSTGIPGASCLP